MNREGRALKTPPRRDRIAELSGAVRERYYSVRRVAQFMVLRRWFVCMVGGFAAALMETATLLVLGGNTEPVCNYLRSRPFAWARRRRIAMALSAARLTLDYGARRTGVDVDEAARY